MFRFHAFTSWYSTVFVVFMPPLPARALEAARAWGGGQKQKHAGSCDFHRDLGSQATRAAGNPRDLAFPIGRNHVKTWAEIWSSGQEPFARARRVIWRRPSSEPVPNRGDCPQARSRWSDGRERVLDIVVARASRRLADGVGRCYPPRGVSLERSDWPARSRAAGGWPWCFTTRAFRRDGIPCLAASLSSFMYYHV